LLHSTLQVSLMVELCESSRADWKYRTGQRRKVFPESIDYRSRAGTEGLIG